MLMCRISNVRKSKMHFTMKQHSFISNRISMTKIIHCFVHLNLNWKQNNLAFCALRWLRHSTCIKQPRTKLFSRPEIPILVAQPTQPVHQPLSEWISQAPKVKRMEYETDNTPSSNVKRYTSTPPYVFTACYKRQLYVTFAPTLYITH